MESTSSSHVAPPTKAVKRQSSSRRTESEGNTQTDEPPSGPIRISGGEGSTRSSELLGSAAVHHQEKKPVGPTHSQAPSHQSAANRERLISWQRTSESFGTFMKNWAPSYVMQNKGATARDHLANERTFLAYMRTSLSLLTVGIAVTQLYRLGITESDPYKHQQAIMAKVLGCLFVAMGGAFILFGVLRYFYAQSLMVKGLFPASRGSVLFGSFVLMAITLVVFVLTAVFV